MAKKIFKYRGKTLEELKELSLNEFVDLIPARERRSIKRGLTESQKILMEQIDAGKNNLKTHVRELVILPKMVGLTINIYTGKTFFQLVITDEMIGHRLGEFAVTRKSTGHSSPGVGATKSSASSSVR
ncbi:30S ribosomal protein S19 [Candidatus Woesearchaeota archaeon]|nr:30S ribosomal protein S19 [Candidatus Woesearchaeota archaeon]